MCVRRVSPPMLIRSQISNFVSNHPSLAISIPINTVLRPPKLTHHNAKSSLPAAVPTPSDNIAVAGRWHLPLPAPAHLDCAQIGVRHTNRQLPSWQSHACRYAGGSSCATDLPPNCESVTTKQIPDDPTITALWTTAMCDIALQPGPWPEVHCSATGNRT